MALSLFIQKNQVSFVLAFLFFSICSYAQTITIKPYLQDVTPDSAKIMWETSSGEQSLVEWGVTSDLGKVTSGIFYPVDYSSKRIHEVKITGLKRFTIYYYRIKTGSVTSDIYQFKTPPFSNDGESFNLLAMSDMQYDSDHPNKFAEIVNEGIMTYFDKTYGGNIPDNLAMVLIPGDLVENGNKIHQWKEKFFNPAEKLFSQVPVYPVLGNHENNSIYYFKYFELPENGTPAYHEHWWYKDYGNTRILGLNSNKVYRDLSEQIEWLNKVLEDTAKNDDIDFVFAQMHHPHKSELWIPGESDFSGKIVKILEDFSTKTGKPSVHFFGHTHGYSRGQSKDHKHLWINVASAGGAIDNWGEFEGRDYDEFTVTQDEYGFVMMEIDDNKTNPKFTLRRISRGNLKNPKNNVLSDSITVFKKSYQPKKPIIAYPKKGDITQMGKLVLKANSFSSVIHKAFHAASNWQISKTPDFSKPVYDKWRQHENWYYNENRQKNDDLTDEEVEVRLKPNVTYYCRVRYRDQHLNWSDWSKAVSFTVK